ncbi:hypothetical protein K402DRAFT_394508 [Aulographum hederae CBS 113979]|uniref:DNA repair protein Dds20/Mei5 n=1 Tax=Aulographum hederae CBS 113979 TaxID=1176131 RepID=A0A6G1GXS0_9PEZI|nr:hypothetical protein K402DRAFT_394508 [Aulographum hederae CBS 113979]
MDTPPLKRRRIDNAASALKKPFKSPFRTTLKPNANSATAATNAPTPTGTKAEEKENAPNGERLVHTGPEDSPVPGATKKPYTPVHPSGLRKSFVLPTTGQTPTSRKIQRHKISNFASANSTPSTAHVSDEYQALSHHHRALTNLSTRLVSETDTLSQALALLNRSLTTSKTRDEELEELVEKWKAAAREAAEEVFGMSKDRVMKMGGIKALREREEINREMRREWEREGREEMVEVVKREERRRRKGERAKMRRAERRMADGETVGDDDRGEGDEDEDEDEESEVEAEDEEAVGRDGAEEEVEGDVDEEEKEAFQENEDNSFTMDMMLRTMNIDLDVIGYDKHRQIWIG